MKFFEFFFRDEATKMKGLSTVYVKGGGAVVKVFDNGMLILMLIFLGLLFAGGVEYVSFTTGLLVGMTIIQVYFHRFSDPLPPEKSPAPPITAHQDALLFRPGKSRQSLEGTDLDDSSVSLVPVYAGSARIRTLHTSSIVLGSFPVVLVGRAGRGNVVGD